MTTIEVSSPIRDFGKLAGVSASIENRIDFLHDDEGAILCTTAFCANELKDYLSRTATETRCVFVDEPSGKNLSIVLECLSAFPGDGGFAFIREGENRLAIRAADRNGLVNGTYELLRMQGWRWIEPGADGEFAPQPHPIVLPEKSRVVTPSFVYRAFYFEFSSQASIDFLLWMARNRMNVFGSFPELRATAKKLGMYILSGGHVITDILKPTRLMPSGRTLFQEHPEWYGKRKNGAEVSAANAQRTQFCCSSKELMDFIAAELIQRLNHEWLGTDILEVSGFDTWGSSCQCDDCRKYTDSDKYLLFMSALRERFDKAAGMECPDGC